MRCGKKQVKMICAGTGLGWHLQQKGLVKLSEDDIF